MKILNNLFQHNFSILDGSIVDRLLLPYLRLLYVSQILRTKRSMNLIMNNHYSGVWLLILIHCLHVQYPQRYFLQVYPILSCVNLILSCMYAVLSCVYPILSFVNPIMFLRL